MKPASIRNIDRSDILISMQIGRLTGIATIKKKFRTQAVLRVFVVESPIYRVSILLKAQFLLCHGVKHSLWRGTSLNKR